LSDLAAMGATPAWALLALTLPSGDRRFVEQFAAGFAELAAQFGVALVGGDTSRGPLSATVAALGFVPTGHALRLAGAVVGDQVFVTGTLGDAAAGLRCLDKHDALATALMSAPAGTREHLVARLDRPTPRIAAGIALRGAANACIDVSDGLLADLGHIAAASRVAIDIELDALPVSSALLTLFDLETRRGFQLSGGDDYELAFTAPAQHAARIAQDLSRIGCGATRIGRVVEGVGVNVVDRNGGRYTSTHAGWNHFA